MELKSARWGRAD
ncbi:hypothetical protein U9M48_033123 [Paspalum notatum var. saurae]|uniref:Uncharacterized protein n=1 Tax=Paspalum notatum var. saurae TaxID=547442 RepID=A0AAQ3U663_PASNO